MAKIDEGIENQIKIINLMLNNQDAVQDFLDSPINIDHFDADYRIIIHAVKHAHEHGVLLTRETFREFIKPLLKTNNVQAEAEVLFNKIKYQDVDRNDFPMLAMKIRDDFLTRKSASLVREFSQDKEKVGITSALDSFSRNIFDLSSSGSTKKPIIYANINEFGQEYWDRFSAIRAGEIEKEDFVSFGFEELDKTTQVGMNPGGLTLFCGDVGGYKSTMMMNIGMNAWLKSGKNVLFVPLEMPREQMQNKIVARHTKIPFEYVANPKAASDEQAEKIHDALITDLPARDGKFFILDSFEQRVRVSILRREIERNIEIFKPNVVVVDYIANLEPDNSRNGRNDLEIGDMLKDLRHMGKKGVVHDEGFHVVSGAQIGRDALKRVRKGGGDQQTQFYSEDIRGSHEYSADADNMFVLFKDPQNPDRLQLFAVKCRYGGTTFPDGKAKATLTVVPNIGLIMSGWEAMTGADSGSILTKADEINKDDSVKIKDDKGFLYEDEEAEEEVDVNPDDIIW